MTTAFKTITHRPAYKGDAPAEYEPGMKVGFRAEASLQFAELQGPPVWTPFGEYRFIVRAETADLPVSLPEDPKLRAEYPVFDGFMAYFPNAMAEVSRLSYKATQQHHPDEDMHWDRSKSLDHLNKIGRHMVDAGKFDDNGIRHSAMIAWRAMANLQEELERQEGYPPSPASRNRPW